MRLHLADNLSLPADLVTQTTLVVGKRGSGKSNTCRRIAEQLFKAGAQFVAIDPTDTWYGLKSSRDGRSPGLGVYVLGGRHQDLPLESTGGALAADVVIDHGISAVLSIKHFSGRERGRFVSDFADRLFRRNSAPLHVFLEEAHEVAPQNPFKGDEEMLGRITRLWKLGRSSGIGGSAITQRPASLSKHITTQAEILIVHRTLGPQDVAAVREWIRYHGEREDILAQLATLKTGEAFVWAPDFPEDKPIGLRRVQMLASETFDSAATPKAGQRNVEPKALAPVDLEKLEAAMAATIGRAKADDPKELRAEITRLKRDLASAQKATPPAAEPVKVPVLEGEELKRAEALVERLGWILEKGEAQTAAVREELATLKAAIAKATAPAGNTFRNERHDSRQESPKPRAATAVSRRDTKSDSRSARPAASTGAAVSLPAGERRILTACAQYPDGCTREQLSILTAFKRSTRDTYIQRLREKDYVEVGELIYATMPGVAALGTFEPLPVGDALRSYWLDKLPDGERKVLEVVCEGHPEAVGRAAIDEATGYKRSTRDTYIQRLTARRLVTAYGPGAVRASAELFDA